MEIIFKLSVFVPIFINNKKDNKCDVKKSSYIVAGNPLLEHPIRNFLLDCVHATIYLHNRVDLPEPPIQLGKYMPKFFIQYIYQKLNRACCSCLLIGISTYHWLWRSSFCSGAPCIELLDKFASVVSPGIGSGSARNHQYFQSNILNHKHEINLSWQNSEYTRKAQL